jgi:threonine dehydrogenase-like Zn-dependent dehydrogenase
MATQMQMPTFTYVDHDDGNCQRVAVMTAPYHMELRFARIPEIAEDEVLIRMKYVGICGSDLEAYRGTRSPEFVSIPARLGHEVAGIVVKTGSKVQGVSEGDAVTCRYVWGAYAQFITCKAFHIVVMPKGFPMIATSLTEILPSVLHACELGKIDATKNVLIMGQGVSGLTLTQAVSLYSPRNLVVTDLRQRNLDLSRLYGATHTYKMPSADASTMDILGKDFPKGFDVVIPALLEGDGVVDAIDCCALCARLVLYGCIGVCSKPIDFFKVHRKRIEIYSTEPRRDVDNRRFFKQGVDYATQGIINTSRIVDRIIPLSRIQEAFEMRNAQKEDVIHILIDCEA